MVQGFNSGVALYHLDNWRRLEGEGGLKGVMDRGYYTFLADKYFIGGLGDQVNNNKNNNYHNKIQNSNNNQNSNNKINNLSN